MFTLCDVLHETKQKKQILDSAQYGLEIIFKQKRQPLRYWNVEM